MYNISVGSPVLENNTINQSKKEQRSLHFAKRQVTPSRQILKSSSNNARDVTFTQFALIDDENISVMQQSTKGGGKFSNIKITLRYIIINNFFKV